ncbi:MAG: hypothetical protein WDN06_12775 [Asticcacaulis sp.]
MPPLFNSNPNLIRPLPPMEAGAFIYGNFHGRTHTTQKENAADCRPRQGRGNRVAGQGAGSSFKERVLPLAYLQGGNAAACSQNAAIKTLSRITKPWRSLWGCWGQSRIRNNANQLAKAVNTGSLPVTPETEARLIPLCDDIAKC